MTRSRESYLTPKKYWGVFSWIFSTDHKRIGVLYLVAGLTFFCAGAALAVLMRLEMLTPGTTLVSAETYDRLFTMHGFTMIFLFVIPVVPGAFGNLFLPIMIGARDMAFPRLNLLSWWLYVSGGVLLYATALTAGGVPDTGWTLYPPYSIVTSTNVSLSAFAIFLVGFSSILTGMNFVTTIHTLRAPGMTWFRMPLFVWTMYATTLTQVLATPVLAIAVLLLIFERFLGVGFFDPAKGGDPIMFQHLFWIYSHPAVYIMVLPAMGVVTEIIPVFARRTVFGYKAIAFSSVAIATFGFTVWGHHMFVSGESGVANMAFSFLTFAVAIPSAVKVFNWLATMYRGSISLQAPMLYAMSFIFFFSVGGITGLTAGALATDVQVHDTYFIVGHFHYVMFGGTGFGFLGGLHYWFPKITGRLYRERPAVIGWAIAFAGFVALYGPMFSLGLDGMPRRYYNYLPRFESLQVFSTVGSWVLVTGLLVVFGNLAWGLFRGERAGANPWGGTTLEWQLPSPLPAENFEETPRMTQGPYVYGD
ncbi:MAG: cytochrome c oxidase subunit I [Proteobacteria bacterium]|nr:cytochrome c oxidase subunit I [Pseudomonadota bacterium]